MKRIIKPFTVEIRGAGRKSSATKSAGPIWPELDDQPDVRWPEIASTVVADVLPDMPARRVLQAMDEPAAGTRADPYLDPRKPPPSRERVAPIVPAETVVVDRVLPAPDVALEVDRDLEGVKPVAVKRPARRARHSKAAQPVETTEPITDLSAIKVEAVAATLVLRRDRTRFTRDDFKRGERWKARLPIAAHKAGKRADPKPT